MNIFRHYSDILIRTPHFYFMINNVIIITIIRTDYNHSITVVVSVVAILFFLHNNNKVLCPCWLQPNVSPQISEVRRAGSPESPPSCRTVSSSSSPHLNISSCCCSIERMDKRSWHDTTVLLQHCCPPAGGANRAVGIKTGSERPEYV